MKPKKPAEAPSANGRRGFPTGNPADDGPADDGAEPQHYASPRRRRSLTHVGGKVSVSGGNRELERTLRQALDVTGHEESTRRHVHGFHSYPGRLHPDIARQLISEWSKVGEVVADPFCGSGTVLVESQELGRIGLGVDANPISVLLTNAKLRSGPPSFRGAWLKAAYGAAKAADKRRTLKEFEIPSPDPRDAALFEPLMLGELIALRSELTKVDDPDVRNVLLLILSSILGKVSRRQGDTSPHLSARSLTSGFAIRFFKNRAAELGKQMAEYDQLCGLQEGIPKSHATLGDARALASLSDSSVNLIVSSPPYPGVYDYHAHHELRLRWLRLNDLEFKGREIGAKRELGRLSSSQAVARWKADYTQVLSEMSRILAPGGRCCLLIADTAVAGQILPGDELSTQLAPNELSPLAIASQERPHFHEEAARAFGGRPKHEHLVVLERRS